jgi:hypothetical protein
MGNVYHSYGAECLASMPNPARFLINGVKTIVFTHERHVLELHEVYVRNEGPALALDTNDDMPIVIGEINAFGRKVEIVVEHSPKLLLGDVDHAMHFVAGDKPQLIGIAREGSNLNPLGVILC